MSWWWPAARSGALSAAVRAWDLLKEVTIIFITSTIVWSLMSWGFPDSSIGKESVYNAGYPGSILESGRSAGAGKNPPAMWETWVQSLGWEDPLEKGKVTHPVFWPGEFHRL